MNVRFTRKALADLDQLRSFIGKENPAAASRLATRLLELAWALGDNPKEGRRTDEPNIHVLIAPPSKLPHLLPNRGGRGTDPPHSSYGPQPVAPLKVCYPSKLFFTR